jgi:hypothetical protein
MSFPPPISLELVCVDLTIAQIRPTQARLKIALAYFADDPLAVHLYFYKPAVEWVFARQLLTDSLQIRPGWPPERHNPYRVNDVLVWQVRHRLILSLAGPQFEVSSRNCFEYAFPLEPVQEFLEDSYRLVPDGQETRYLDFRFTS